MIEGEPGRPEPGGKQPSILVDGGIRELFARYESMHLLFHLESAHLVLDAVSPMLGVEINDTHDTIRVKHIRNSVNRSVIWWDLQRNV